MFNIGRDICHYRRGQLKPSTIRELMIVFCYFHRNAIDEKKALDLEGVDLEEIPEDKIIAELERRATELEEAMDIQYVSDAEDLWDRSPVRNRNVQKRPVITQDLNSDYGNSPLRDSSPLRENSPPSDNYNIDDTVYDLRSSSPVLPEPHDLVQRSPSPQRVGSPINKSKVSRLHQPSSSPDVFSQVTLPAMRRRKKGRNQLLSLLDLPLKNK